MYFLIYKVMAFCYDYIIIVVIIVVIIVIKIVYYIQFCVCVYTYLYLNLKNVIDASALLACVYMNMSVLPLWRTSTINTC